MNRSALGRLTVGGVLFVIAVLLLGSSLSSELRPSASSGTSNVLSWEKKISITESLGLPTRLPSPFHRIEWGNKRGSTEGTDRTVDNTLNVFFTCSHSHFIF